MKECLRLSLPKKPHLCLQTLGGDEDYAELSTKFKAAHVKILLWWLARESQRWADSHPDVPC
jgi:hypothetical protein